MAFYIIQAIASMQIVDILRSGALVVAFLSIFIGNWNLSKNELPNWILVDTISTAAFGAGWLLFPDSLLGYMVVGKLDPIHLMVSRVMGAIMLAQAVVACQRVSTKRSPNLLVKSLTLTLLLGCMAVAQYRSLKDGKQKFNYSHLTFGILGAFLWLLMNLWPLLRQPDLGSRQARPLSLRSIPNMVALLDMVMMTLAVVMYLGFPSYPLSFVSVAKFKFDMVHLHMYRAMGVLLLGDVLHYLVAFATGSSEARHSEITRRLVTMVMVIPIVMAYQWWYVIVPANTFIQTQVINMVSVAALAAAYYRGLKE